MEDENKTPKAEAMDALRESLKDFYVLKRDNMWGKAGEVVKHVRSYGTPSRRASEWICSNGWNAGYVACDLEYCIERGDVIPLFDHMILKMGGDI